MTHFFRTFIFEQVIKAAAIELYDKMKSDITKIFANLQHVTLTVDGWTAENGCGLLGVMVHWVDD